MSRVFVFLAISVLFIIGRCAQAEVPMTWEPVVIADHISDVGRKGSEPSTDFIGSGFTVTIGRRKRFEVDVAHGLKKFSGTLHNSDPAGDDWQNATKVQLRWYPRRGRQ